MNFSAEQINQLRITYLQGGNLTQLIRKWDMPIDEQTITFIYEMQAGTYTQNTLEHPNQSKLFTDEIVKTLSKFVGAEDLLLDCGTGEATTLIPIMSALQVRKALAFDISYSRLSWAAENLKKSSLNVELAVASIRDIPLPSDSIDCVLTIHAIEPNGGFEDEILSELARVTKNYLFLVEPDFESASKAQKDRMESLNYIGSLGTSIVKSGLKVVQKTPIINNSNAMNKASVFVLKKNRVNDDSREKNELRFGLDRLWVDPVLREPLRNFSTGLINNSGLWYPILNGIPFLRPTDTQLVLSPYKSG